MKKLFTMSAVAIVALGASAANEVSVIQSNPAMTPEAISPNGKWAAGGQSIWNVEGGSVVTTEEGAIALFGVSNTGVAVGSEGDYAVMMTPDGKVSYFDGDETYSVARAINADGTIIVGCRFDANFFGDACYWVNGEYRKLPTPEVYEGIPEETGVQYSVATGISEDGSVIIGNLVTGMAVDAFVYWTRNAAGEYEYHPAYLDYMEFGFEEVKPYINMTAEYVSANGQWVSLTTQPNSWEDEHTYMARFNVANGTYETAKAPVDMTGDCYAKGISNQGIVVGYLEQMESSMTGRVGLIWKTDTDTPTKVSTYCGGNAEVVALENKEGMTATDISANGSRMTGFVVQGAAFESFIINLPDVKNGVANVAVDGESVTGVYDLQGRRVNGQPAAGLYIVIENGKAQKVMVK